MGEVKMNSPFAGEATGLPLPYANQETSEATAGDECPEFSPIMLRGLTYSQVLQQMRVTGCAGRRHHWCSPVIVYEGAELIFDNEDQVEPWRATAADRRASDWEMTPRPEGPQ
jgi:hypothetical protein